MAPTLGFGDLTDALHEQDKFAFGEDIVYEPKSGGTFNIVGIFNQIHDQIDVDTQRVVASNDPTMGIKLSDLPLAPVKGDIVRIPSRSLVFRVADSQEDGEGMSELKLDRVST